MTGKIRERLNPYRLGHANIFVSSISASVGFYHDICGLETVYSEFPNWRQQPYDVLRGMFYSGGACHHDIGTPKVTATGKTGRDGHMQIPVGRGLRPGINHLGWEIATEKKLVLALDSLRAAGIKPHRIADHGISRSVYLFDEDGLLHEFYCDTVTDWQKFFDEWSDEPITSDWKPDLDTAMDRSLTVCDFNRRIVNGAAFHPISIGHVVLVVSDLEKSLSFYVDCVGLDVKRCDPKNGVAVLAGGNGLAALVLLSRTPELELGLHHISFDVESKAEVMASWESVRSRSDLNPRLVETDLKSGAFVCSSDGVIAQFVAKEFRQHLVERPLPGVDPFLY
jgi:catechol 2,3-dioxygenase